MVVAGWRSSGVVRAAAVVMVADCWLGLVGLWLESRGGERIQLGLRGQDGQTGAPKKGRRR